MCSWGIKGKGKERVNIQQPKRKITMNLGLQLHLNIQIQIESQPQLLILAFLLFPAAASTEDPAHSFAGTARYSVQGVTCCVLDEIAGLADAGEATQGTAVLTLLLLLGALAALATGSVYLLVVVHVGVVVSLAEFLGRSGAAFTVLRGLRGALFWFGFGFFVGRLGFLFGCFVFLLLGFLFRLRFFFWFWFLFLFFLFGLRVFVLLFVFFFFFFFGLVFCGVVGVLGLLFLSFLITSRRVLLLRGGRGRGSVVVVVLSFLGRVVGRRLRLTI